MHLKDSWAHRDYLKCYLFHDPLIEFLQQQKIIIQTSINLSFIFKITTEISFYSSYNFKQF